MRLISVRLHPFGATTDHTFRFANSTTVIHGPNEAGKSTIREALLHVLFTPTNLTPKRGDTRMRRWYPLPEGDHCRVTLVCEAAGESWTVTKTWGASAASSLSSQLHGSIADATAVQSRLNELLRFNEATWRHILFTAQAELANTISELKDNSESVDSLRSALSTATRISGDIEPTRLASALQARIDDFFSRWDDDLARPEGGRGIENPWKREVGRVLQAYYRQEEARRDYQMAANYEVEVDRVNLGLRNLNHRVVPLRIVVADARALRGDASQRETLEERRKRRTTEVTQLATEYGDWVSAEHATSNGAILEEAQRQLDLLDEELRHARHRELSSQLTRDFEAIQRARKELDAAEEQLRNAPSIDEPTFTELRELEASLAETQIRVDAQTLAIRLEATAPCEVTVQRGSREPEAIRVTSESAWTTDAAGRVIVSSGDLRVTVQSKQADVDALLDTLQRDTDRRDTLLQECECASMSDVEKARADCDRIKGELATCRVVLTRALKDKSPEAWQAEMADLAAIPSTRSTEFLEAEQRKQSDVVARLRLTWDQATDRVKVLQAAHKSRAQLEEKRFEAASDVKQIERELSALGSLPAGFESAAHFLVALKENEDELERLIDERRELEGQQQRLVGSAPARTAEELREELDMAERAFSLTIEEGRSYTRILKTLNEISHSSESDPLSAYRTRLEEGFAALTQNRYQGMSLDGTLPKQVSGPNGSIDVGWLSHGTHGSLALATRLAMAEAYLDGDEGVIVMDDPLTEMDQGRRASAIEAIVAFGAKHQVVLLSCHDLHVAELSGAGASILPLDR